MKMILFLLPLALLAGCSDDDGTVKPPTPTETPSVERGRYLADHVGPCAQCHTPKGPDGQPDPMKYLGGDMNERDNEMEAVEWLAFEDVEHRLTYPSDKKVWEEAKKVIRSEE